MTVPVVSIVLINYNGRDDTLECLRSLARVTYPKTRVYVVDNGSMVKIKNDVTSILPQAVVIENARNEGFTGGNNIGCRRALADGADYVMMLNNDTVVEPGFVDPLVAAMEADSTLGACTPKIYFHGSDREFWAYGARIDRWTGRSPHIGVYERDRSQYDSLRDVDRITGCAMFARRSIFERVGFLDERFFIYEEELDWCLRIRRSGYRLRVIPASVIWHKGHRDSGRVGRPFISYLQTRNHFLLLRKHSDHLIAHGIFALTYAMAAATKNMILDATYTVGRRQRRYWDDLRAIVHGISDGILGRYGRPEPYLKQRG